MRHRDHVGYHRGKQVVKKMIVVTFLGWTLNEKKWDPKKAISCPVIEHLNKKDKLTLWYTMYKEAKPLPLPFRTEGKRITQWNDVTPLYHLQSGKHYVAWCLNIKDESYNKDVSGEWFWYNTFEVAPPQANDVIRFKRTRSDIDKPVSKDEVQCIAEMGYPDGNQFYALLTSMYGTEPKKYEWKLAYDKYMEDNGKKRVGKRMQQFDDTVKKSRHVNDLLSF